MDKAKSIFQSKTFWFNLASSVAVISGALPPSKTVLAVAAAANIGLRLITTQPAVLLADDSK